MGEGMTGEAVLVPVLPNHRFDEAALDRYLRAHLPGYAGDAEIRQFQGGQSNPTFHLRTRDQEFVLRKKPPGVLLASAHAVDREYAVLSALAGSDVPVPKTRVLCTDDSIIGQMFYVMDHVPGRIFADGLLPGCSVAERAAIYDSMNEVYAKLHLVDWRAVGRRRRLDRSIAGPRGWAFEYFYGFLSAFDSQYYPRLYRDTTPVEPQKTPAEGYNLTDDLTNDAIRWMHLQQASSDKPFFVYFATGATHTPHQVPKKWIEQYRGKFDEGWDKLPRRERSGGRRAGCDSGERRGYAASQGAAGVGLPSGGSEEIAGAAGGDLRGLYDAGRPRYRAPDPGDQG